MQARNRCKADDADFFGRTPSYQSRHRVGVMRKLPISLSSYHLDCHGTINSGRGVLLTRRKNTGLMSGQLCVTVQNCSPLYASVNSGPRILTFQKRNSPANALSTRELNWVQGLDLNQRPSGYEPDELPGCSTLQQEEWSPCESTADLSTAFSAKCKWQARRREPLHGPQIPACQWARGRVWSAPFPPPIPRSLRGSRVSLPPQPSHDRKAALRPACVSDDTLIP